MANNTSAQCQPLYLVCHKWEHKWVIELVQELSVHFIYKQKKTFWRVHPSQLGALSSKECQHWGATLRGKKTPEHLTPSTSKCNKWKAWNSLWESQPSQTTPSGEGAARLSGKYSSASPSDPSLSAKNLVLRYFNSVPSPGYTPLSHKQSSLFFLTFTPSYTCPSSLL